MAFTGMADVTCPACGHQGSVVKDTRGHTDGDRIRRYRACLGCGARFTTLERMEPPVDRGSIVRARQILAEAERLGLL